MADSRNLTSLSIIFSALLIAGSLIISGGSYASAQEHPDINFPVSELGNCANEEECKTYCDKPANIGACINFAEANGLMDKGRADVARKFDDSLQRGDTPGRCDSQGECEIYCEDISHIEECIAFADEHGHKIHDLDESRKVAKHLRDGGKTPGNCTSRRECESYCSDFSHVDECLAFSDEVGFEREDDHELDREQIKKITELMKNGETPGRCASREECERYCAVESHVEECVAFGEKVGFVDHEQGERIRKTGGKGPGGCFGREECQAFCQDESNREQCFNFAREHNILTDEHRSQVDEGLNKVRGALDEAPEEVRKCVGGALGDGSLDGIEDGSYFPNEADGQAFQRCFEEFHKEQAQQPIDESGPRPEDFEGEFRRDEFEGSDPFGPPEFDGEDRHAPRPKELERYKAEVRDQYEEEYRPDYVETDRIEHQIDTRVEEQFEQRFEQQFDQQFQEQFKQEFDNQYQQQYDVQQQQIEEQIRTQYEGQIQNLEQELIEARNRESNSVMSASIGTAVMLLLGL